MNMSTQRILQCNQSKFNIFANISCTLASTTNYKQNEFYLYILSQHKPTFCKRLVKNIFRVPPQ